MDYSRAGFYKVAARLVFAEGISVFDNGLVGKLGDIFQGLELEQLTALVEPVVWEMTGMNYHHAAGVLPPSDAEDLVTRILGVYTLHIEGIEKVHGLD